MRAFVWEGLLQGHHDVEAFCAKKVQQTVAGACLDDIEAFCAAVTPGGSAIHSCLYQHKAELGKSCKGYMHLTGEHLPAVTPDAHKEAKPAAKKETKEQMEALHKKEAAVMARRVNPSVDIEARKKEDAQQQQQQQQPHFKAIKAQTTAVTQEQQKQQQQGLPQQQQQPAKLSRKTILIYASCIGVAAIVVAALVALIRRTTSRAAGPSDKQVFSSMMI